MSGVRKKVRARIRALPERPGIYIFLGESSEPLYVGKARSLRKRGMTYLGRAQEPRLERMLSEAKDLEFLVTDGEAEALLLENNWIKQKKPRFNILLRDDKTYPYIKLTAEQFPRVEFTRRIANDGADYFGPYLPGGLARRAIKLVQKLFQLRVCTIAIDGRLPRPCLYHDMKRCLGPCVDGLTTPEEYASAVQEARLFLSGRTDELVAGLRRRMRESSEKLLYEDAARCRDLLRDISSIDRRSKMSSVHGDDIDIFGASVQGAQAAVVVLVMRGGQVLDRREIFWEGKDATTLEALLSELLPQLYAATTFIPKEIHLPAPVEGLEALASWLEERKRERVYIRSPARGPKAQRVALAGRNAALALKRRFRAPAAAVALEALREALGLLDFPRRIEGFDVSNLQGSSTVASLVVCEEGVMRKSSYRSFNIRSTAGGDDYAALHEAVFRRYSRRLREIGEMPDLILIDGGRGQLNAAVAALAELGVEEIPCIGLAKREEELFLVDRPTSLRLPPNHAGLQLLQRIRDESHRFAVGRHRRKRRSSTLRSALDEVRGVGPKRKKALLNRFGSVEGIRQAEQSEIAKVVGPSLAARLKRRVGSD